MISSLFSSFDPCSSIPFSRNWLRRFIRILILFRIYWVNPNRIIVIFNKISLTLHNEFKVLLGTKNLGITLIFISLLIFIACNNFMGLYPYIFTRSRHIAITLSLSLPLWVCFIMYGWINHTNHIFSHLVPQRTPGILIPFIVLIETISNFIRPGTLAVRLAANIIAGHLLITLLGNQTSSANRILVVFLLLTQVTLLTLESAVAIIQSYVFAVLTTLYSREVTHH